MANYKYVLSVSIDVSGAEEETAEPGEYVADAVQTLLNDHLDEWLLEAIGHPHPREASVTVSHLTTYDKEQNDG